MFYNLFTKVGLTALILIFIGFSQVFAQKDKAPWTQKAVYWADVNSGVEVFLYPTKNANYRLVVLSQKDVKVTYHTKINSFEPVDKEIPLKEKAGCAVNIFEFAHNFSRTTIWMSLEFTIDGQKAPELMRTFYNSIYEVVPNEQFMLDKKSKN